MDCACFTFIKKRPKISEKKNKISAHNPALSEIYQRICETKDEALIVQS